MTTMTTFRRCVVAMSFLAATAACVPDPGPAPTRLDITTLLTWCGGVAPPPGEPACHTSITSTDVEVLRGREVVAGGTTAADGHLLIEVVPGNYTVRAADAPTYMQCDTPAVTAVEHHNTVVVQTCTVFAP